MSLFRPSRRRILVLSLCAVLVLLLLIGANLAVRWANAPVEESIHIDSNPRVSAPVTYKTVEAAFFRFEVPSSYGVKMTTDTSNPNLVHTQVFQTTSAGLQLGITTNLLPDDGLKGVADYNLRATTPVNYRPLATPNLPAGSKGFQRGADTTNPAELTLFLVHGNRYASLTLSGGSESDRQAVFTHAYESWRWL